MCTCVGSGIGLQFHYVVAAFIVVLVLGAERIVLASALAAFGVVIVTVLELRAPHDTGVQPAWAFASGFIVNTIAAWVLVIATVWSSPRGTARAEAAMESEYERSEPLLANVLPASIAARLKAPLDPVRRHRRLHQACKRHVADLTDARGRAVPLRIGLASGPVVAGAVGSRKFFYDVWGVYERLRDRFVVDERGEIEVKGKGMMRTWYLTGRRH